MVVAATTRSDTMRTAAYRAMGEAGDMGASARREMRRGGVSVGQLRRRAVREGAGVERTRPAVAHEVVRNHSRVTDKTTPCAV